MEPNTFENGGLKSWQKGLIIAVVIIVLAVVVYAIAKPKSTTEDVTTDAQNPSQVVDKTANNIVVSDNYPGNVVLIQQVQLAAPGFVVIHKDEAGKPGKVIGYQYFEAGIRPGRVNLTENTVDGGKYWAMLHEDTGSDKAFSETPDAPIRDKAGNIVMKPFKAMNILPEFKG
jgi:hypothetical protein